MRTIQIFTRVLLLAITTCILVHPPRRAVAQVDRTGLTGTITDPSGKVVPGVRVVAEMPDTGLRRETLSSGTGTFDIPELPVGTYAVTFSGKGFAPLIFTQVVQTVGQTRTLDATLRLSGAKERVQVSASSADMDKTSDTLGVSISKVQAEELPLNGRHWANLTAFQPSAIDTGGSNQRSIRFAGRGRDDDNFTYDGIDATNIINQAQQPYVRLAIPLDTIEEIRVDAMLATAEAGATGGPQLAVTSNSGTNQFHGNAFEYFRNNVFDALQPVPVTTTPQPPFHLNQFGGSIGGPIVHDKTFFFLAYEGYRQNWGFPLLGYVPSAAFRAQVAKDSPILIPILNAYPQGQIPTDDPRINEFTSEGRQKVFENSPMILLDQHVSA